MKKIRLPRVVLLFVMLVLTQACAAGGAGTPVMASPPAPKVFGRELSGCSGDRFRIDLLEAIGTLPDDTLDAQREQLRDWIWTVTLGRIAQRTSAEEVLSGVAGAPLVRDDALAHVLRMQVGPTRSTSTKSGGAIVMVEVADTSVMTAEVAEAIDNEALYGGSIPTNAQVYQYVFHPDVARAEVCALKTLTRAELESTAQHYRSATITTAAQFEDFLSGGVDLLSAQCTEAGLQVAGRQRPRTAKTPVTIEQIAALAQARGARFIPLERFGFSLDRLSNRAQLAENARQIDALRGPVEIQPRDIQILLGWKRQNPGVSTQELLMSLQLQKKAWGRPGFSLDPETNDSFATGLLDDMIGALPDVEKLAPILRGLKERERATSLIDTAKYTNEPFAAEAKAALSAARDKLKRARREESDAILHPSLPKSLGNSLAEDLMKVVYKASTYQCARYDGPLHGTATGMTFFYTDLIAKIWNIDLDGAAPEGPIEGFQSAIHEASSTTSCDDIGGKNTRTWFGVRDESFTREALGTVHFAPIATRIFARSSNPGARHEEFEATAESKRFVQWWDAHFPQVAEWEPQYEVLNQLMKWSVVVQSSVVTDQYSCLAALDGVKVESGHHIDTWIVETKDLKWHGPVSLLAPPKGSKEKPEDHECMPLFESRRYSLCGYDDATIAGGVGAASFSMVKAKPTRVEAIPRNLGHLGAEAPPVIGGEGLVRFAKLSRSEGELSNVLIESHPAQVKFTAEVSTEASQVGVASSWDKRAPIRQIEESINIRGTRLVASETKNGLVSAELSASDLRAADVALEVKPGAVQQARSSGQKIAKRVQHDGVSLSEAARAEFGATHEVVPLADGSVAVRIDSGAERPQWVHMESGAGNRGPPPPGVDAGVVIGVPDGAPYRPGSSLSSRESVVHASLLDERATTKLFEARKVNPPSDSDRTLVTVKDKLQRKDVEGAMLALEQSPTPAAQGLLLDHVLENKDDARLKRVVDEAIKTSRSPSETAALREKLKVERPLRVRAGDDPRAIDDLALRLAIAERRGLTSGRAKEPIDAAFKGRSAIYEPPSYASAADLPPAVHPPGKLLLPEDQYVSRVIQDAAAKNLPKTIEVGDAKYEMRAPGTDAPIAYSEVGSPYRLLLGSYRPVVVVTRCSDTNPALPPCHELPSPEQRQMADELWKCDLDNDDAFSTAAERACLDAVHKSRSKPSPAKSAP